MEEREEAYQRVRDRLFAHDSACSQESLFVENSRLLEDSNTCNETYKKRQLFRGNRDGSGRTSGSQQSSSETELRWPDPQRAWSSTDSDSSNRSLKPAMTKTASFGGIAMLTRGDSTSSTRSTGKLSKAGQPFVNPDGTPAIYNPPTTQQPLRGAVMGQSPQQPQRQPSPQPQRQGQPPRLPLAGPLVTQGLQPPSPSARFPAVAFPAQRLLPVPPTQQLPLGDDVATQFGQMDLSRQSSGETPEPPAGPVYPAPLGPQPSQQPSYVIASAGPQLPAAGFSGSGPPVPQQVLQPPPPAQMPVYCYPPGQYPTSAPQPFGPAASAQYSGQRAPQAPPPAQHAG